jgi:hypothetical protein
MKDNFIYKSYDLADLIDFGYTIPAAGFRILTEKQRVNFFAIFDQHRIIFKVLIVFYYKIIIKNGNLVL